jgi:hypothetical protein
MEKLRETTKIDVSAGIRSGIIPNKSVNSYQNSKLHGKGWVVINLFAHP